MTTNHSCFLWATSTPRRPAPEHRHADVQIYCQQSPQPPTKVYWYMIFPFACLCFPTFRLVLNRQPKANTRHLLEMQHLPAPVSHAQPHTATARDGSTMSSNRVTCTVLQSTLRQKPEPTLLDNIEVSMHPNSTRCGHTLMFILASILTG